MTLRICISKIYKILEGIVSMNSVGFSNEFPEFLTSSPKFRGLKLIETNSMGPFKMVNPTEFTLGIVNTIINDFRFCGKSASGK